MTIESVNFCDVQAKAAEFFHRHWPTVLGSFPAWNDEWNLHGSMPGHDSQGIYVLMSKTGAVLYIGVGASLGDGIYIGCGLGARIKRYIRVSKRENNETSYSPKSEWAERGLSKIVTLSFEKEYAYLAYALEAYLLRELKTPFNSVRSARTKND